MPTDSNPFVILNVGRFPMITLNQHAVVAGYANQWMREMSLLIEQGVPFVMVYDHMRAGGPPATRPLADSASKAAQRGVPGDDQH